jgi:hypothetical protein
VIACVVRSAVPPELEEEFNDWQELEHVPRLLAVPGYRGVSRFYSKDEPGAYMNVWLLDDVDTFDSPERHRASRTGWRQRIARKRLSHKVSLHEADEEASHFLQAPPPQVLLIDGDAAGGLLLRAVEGRAECDFRVVDGSQGLVAGATKSYELMWSLNARTS